MTYYTADSYKDFERIDEPFEKNGRLYTKVAQTCDRCGGTGIFRWTTGFGTQSGTCFKCNGAGKISKEVRLYTEKQYTAMRKKKEQTEKSVAAMEEFIAQVHKKAFDRWLKFNGFNEDGETYLIFGNTYPIKDELKTAGCKFSKELKWHGPAAVEVPEDCYIEKIHWSDVYDWNEATTEMKFSEEGENFLNGVFSKNTTGMFIGEIDERLRNMNAVFEYVAPYSSSYGDANIYHFNVDGAQLVWLTSVYKDLEEGETYNLSGTVKDHKVYGNVKTTYLNRCTIKKA